jgi:hypothetical protein
MGYTLRREKVMPKPQFKPVGGTSGAGRPSPQELAAAMGAQLQQVPAAVPPTSAVAPEPAPAAPRKPVAPPPVPTVQINFRGSRRLARLLNEAAEARGLTQRALIAQGLQALGVKGVPEEDLHPHPRRRSFDDLD